jgi:GntR family transcriptional regulator/MocR family aminotransferase
MARTRTSSAIEVLLPLDREAPDPLHRQLERELREAVRNGRLAAGSALPSSRALAGQLGVSRGIVVEAYEQLAAEGYLATRPGGLTTVARGARPTPPRQLPSDLHLVEFDFRPGRPDLDLFPRETWLRSIRRALDVMPSSRLGYLDGRGMPELRNALADYLNRVRGTAADAQDIVICAGFSQGLKLVAGVLRDGGARRIAIEDPTQPETREDLRALGLDVVELPVDDVGLRVDALETANADAVVVTAAHQYPTGGVLTPERRTALLSWAERRGAVIVEDDYDAEFRYDRDPIGALQGLSPDRVVYAGSASKILAPGLRLGWFVVPTAFSDAVAGAKRAADLGSPAIDQLAFADFLARGELDRHLRRLRPIYRARRDRLLDALARHLPELRPVGASAGLHVLAWLPADLDERAVVDAAAAAGIQLTGVGPRSRTGPSTGPGGLTFGYGAITETAIDPAVARLAGVIEGVRRRGGVREATG